MANENGIVRLGLDGRSQSALVRGETHTAAIDYDIRYRTVLLDPVSFSIFSISLYFVRDTLSSCMVVSIPSCVCQYVRLSASQTPTTQLL